MSDGAPLHLVPRFYLGMSTGGRASSAKEGSVSGKYLRF